MILINQPLSPLKDNSVRIILSIKGKQYALETKIEDKEIEEIKQMVEQMQYSFEKEKL